MHTNGTASAELTRQWTAPFAVDVKSVLGVHRRGYGDPAFHLDQAGAIWRACRTPAGPGTVRITWAAAFANPAPPVFANTGGQQLGTVVHAAAWGPGADWLLSAVPAMLGAQDNPEDFDTDHPVLLAVARRRTGYRIGRSGLVLESLVPAVLEQKVVGMEATRAWHLLLLRYGEVAPGPVPVAMRVPLSPQGWASIPSWEWHKAGVEAVRARTIAGAARVASRLEEIVGLPADEADRRLRSLPGIGVWTSAEIRQRACGDADAVSVGDYHLPKLVGCALAGEPTDDAGMLALLAPYAGHRHRAAMLAAMSGAGPERHGPRNSVRDYRAI